MKTIRSIAIGWLLSVLIVIVLSSIFTVFNSSSKLSLDFLIGFPFLLTVYPFKVINHYPETLFVIVVYVAAISVMHKKWKILEKIKYSVLAFSGWEILGLMVLVRQMLDF